MLHNKTKESEIVDDTQRLMKEALMCLSLLGKKGSREEDSEPSFEGPRTSSELGSSIFPLPRKILTPDTRKEGSRRFQMQSFGSDNLANVFVNPERKNTKMASRENKANAFVNPARMKRKESYDQISTYPERSPEHPRSPKRYTIDLSTSFDQDKISSYPERPKKRSRSAKRHAATSKDSPRPHKRRASFDKEPATKRRKKRVYDFPITFKIVPGTRGVILGKYGQYIKTIQEVSQCDIQIDNGKVTIFKGENPALAREIIEEIAYKASKKKGGRTSATVARIFRSYGIKIDGLHKSPPAKKPSDSSPKKQIASAYVVMVIKHHCLGMLIGKNGFMINKLINDFDVEINYNKGPKKDFKSKDKSEILVVIRGRIKCITNAVYFISRDVFTQDCVEFGIADDDRKKFVKSAEFMNFPTESYLVSKKGEKFINWEWKVIIVRVEHLKKLTRNGLEDFIAVMAYCFGRIKRIVPRAFAKKFEHNESVHKLSVWPITPKSKPSKSHDSSKKKVRSSTSHSSRKTYPSDYSSSPRDRKANKKHRKEFKQSPSNSSKKEKRLKKKKRKFIVVKDEHRN